MFKSFFPKPLLFLASVIIWGAITVLLWFSLGEDIGSLLGFTFPEAGADPIIGLGYFVTSDFIWFYIYYLFITLVFAGFWSVFAPHKWQMWSVLGSALILFSTYFGVQVSVAVNNWRRPFFDAVQDALTSEGDVSAAELFDYIQIFAELAFVFVAVFVVTRFFVSHYIFRWRTAMNDYYVENWQRLRGVEGAAQRIQEDTMRFASIMEGLGVSIVESVMTLFAFLPVLNALSEYVKVLPIVGDIPNPLLWASIFWAIFGTVLLAFVGLKLPGLEFRNQRVEAALRKELVYGEDDAARAGPMTISDLFNNVRRNYFRLYFHYMYFNIARSFYIQADNIFVFLLLIPTIVTGTITLGILQQILTAFGQVSTSFQYVINAWPTIIELLSIHKRLKAFESVLSDKPLPDIDQQYIAGADTDD